MDDFGIGGTTDQDNVAALADLFAVMIKRNYKLGADKLWLGYQELCFLGHLIRDGHILPDPEKTKAIHELLPPNTKSQVRAFLGITGYYRIFVYKYAAIAKPLSSLL